MIDIVVAHYNEDLSWIDQYREGNRVFIYSKGNNKVGYPLDNIGREAHTYWYHILNVLDKSEYTAFLQGNPFQHTDNLTERLQQRGTFNWISNWIVSDNGLAQHHWHRLPIHDMCQQLLGYTRHEYLFGAGCQSIVHSSLLQPKPLFETIYQLCIDNPDFAWINERLWYYFVTA